MLNGGKSKAVLPKINYNTSKQIGDYTGRTLALVLSFLVAGRLNLLFFFSLPEWVTNITGKDVGERNGADSLAFTPRLQAGENGGFGSQGYKKPDEKIP